MMQASSQNISCQMNRYDFGTESLCWWYPRVKQLCVPQPKTFIIHLDQDEFAQFAFLNRDLPESFVVNLFRHACVLGYPVFLRTDITAFKQAWERSCFVRCESLLLRNLQNLLRYSFLIGDCKFQTKAAVLREYLPLLSHFSCYSGGLPVCTEMRYFVSSGEVLCRHPYWTAEMVHNPDCDDWRKKLEKANRVNRADILQLDSVAHRVAGLFREHELAIDFVKTKNDVWYLIDIAPAEHSYRPVPDCPQCSPGYAHYREQGFGYRGQRL